MFSFTVNFIGYISMYVGLYSSDFTKKMNVLIYELSIILIQALLLVYYYLYKLYPYIK